MIFTLVLFGTIGTVSRYIDIPTSVLCAIRAFIGAAVLVLYINAVLGRRTDTKAVHRNLRLLVFAGVMNGINWLLIFEGFRRTTVAIASICYYMQPVFLMLCAPLLFGEKKSVRKACCIAAGFFGMVIIADPFSDAVDTETYKGIACSLLAAAAYTANVAAAKKFRDISSLDATVAELVIAGTVLLPYIWMTEATDSIVWNTRSIVLTIVMGVLHTGIAYAVYYSSLRRLRADTVAVLGYIDPLTSVALSVLVLGEPLTASTAAGGIMILGASFIGSREKSP